MHERNTPSAAIPPVSLTLLSTSIRFLEKRNITMRLALSYLRLATGTVALAILASTSAMALEMSAGGREVQANSAVDMKLDAVNAALTSAINQILACNNKGMIFASNGSRPGRDVDGCVSLDTGTPAGIVASFNSATCPSGWTVLTAARNRVIVGAGGSYAFGAMGGNNTVAIARANLPAVRLNIYAHQYVGDDDAAAQNNLSSARPLLANRKTRTSNANSGMGASVYSWTDLLGSGTPLNVMPPYLALTQCVKN
jgi:hypothetical protein